MTHMWFSLKVIHSPTHICIDACMNINSPAHDLQIFSLFSPSLNSLTLEVVGQWSHFSPILPAIRSFVINTVVNYAGIPPLLIGITTLPLRLRGLEACRARVGLGISEGSDAFGEKIRIRKRKGR